MISHEQAVKAMDPPSDWLLHVLKTIRSNMDRGIKGDLATCPKTVGGYEANKICQAFCNALFPDFESNSNQPCPCIVAGDEVAIKRLDEYIKHYGA